MTQSKPTKSKTFHYETISLNKGLNPNLKFNFLYSQKLFKEYKVIVYSFCSLKSENFLNQIIVYAYGKIASVLAQHPQNLKN